MLTKMGVLNFLITLFVCSFALCEGTTTCLDENGNEIDWYVIYKLPRLPDSELELEREGLAYYYLDVNQQQWSRGADSLNGTNHAVYHTLQQVYSDGSGNDQMHIFYNDEAPPKVTSFDHGHTKGCVASDKESGFWLVHSLPRFPPHVADSYSYPHSGLIYGQTFLCMSLPYAQLDKIGMQLLYTWPQVYDHNLPSQMAEDNPNMAKVVNNKHVQEEPWNNTMLLQTMQGQKFTSLAKFSHYDADLYKNWVAPYIGSSVAVETWQHHGGEDLPSYCGTPYQVHNIVSLKVGDTVFEEHKDHAKWAVSQDGKKTWICIGGINRQYSQEKRAGGTVCSDLPGVWASFKDAITDVEPCPKDAQEEKQHSPIDEL